MSSSRFASSHAPDEDRQNTAEVDSARSLASRTDVIVRLGIAGFAVYFWTIAILMSVAPKFFFAHIGPFGALNVHYIRDTATFNAAFAAGLTVAYKRASWLAVLLTRALKPQTPPQPSVAP